MPIYKGDKKIVKVYKGSQEIKKIYKGEQEVYQHGERVVLFYLADDPSLPVYKARYVTSISVGVVLSFNAQPNTNPLERKYLLQYIGLSTSSYIYVQKLSKTVIDYDSIRLGGTNNDFLLPTNGKHTIIIDKTKVYVDGVFAQELTIGEETDEYDIQKIRINSDTHFCELKIYDDGVLIYDFVPCYMIASDNTLVFGVAELVNHYYQPNGSLFGEPEYQ